MPKTLKKVSKSKVSTKTKVAKVTKSSKSANPMAISAIIAISAVLVGPAVWYFTQSFTYSALLLFLIPASVSFVAAAMFKDVTGVEMSETFRRETTTATAVFAVILSVIVGVLAPRIGFDGKADIVLPMFMIIYRSLWAIIGVLVSVYLPLGMTIPKK